MERRQRKIEKGEDKRVKDSRDDKEEKERERERERQRRG